MKIYYNPGLKQLARKLRKSGNLSEVLLWNQLKARKMKGYRFMRQKPIGDYIVDFFCSELRLVIEIDGESHSIRSRADHLRQRNLESLGFSVLRFYDWEVRNNLNGVVTAIEQWIESIESSNCGSDR